MAHRCMSIGGCTIRIPTAAEFGARSTDYLKQVHNTTIRLFSHAAESCFYEQWVRDTVKWKYHRAIREGEQGKRGVNDFAAKVEK